MEWPSKAVSYGGMLHPAKTTYSPETHKFIKVLMEENKLSMMQRKKINYYLRSGEPLPGQTSKSTTSLNSRRIPPPILICPGSSQRRSRETIVKSGAYEIEKLMPRLPRVDREKEKARLQNKMAFGKDIEPQITVKKVTTRIPKTDETNRFDELVQEIEDRKEWLKNMEALGAAGQHRLVIQQQIEERIREIENLKLEDSKSERK